MKCPKHPKYQAIRRPLADCKDCWDLYQAKKGEAMANKNKGKKETKKSSTKKK